MKRSILFVIGALICATIVVTSCIASAPGEYQECGEQMCINLVLSTPVPFNEPVDVTITLETDVDMDGVIVRLSADDTSVLIGQDLWAFNTTAHQPITFSTTVTFGQEGSILFRAHARTSDWTDGAQDVVYLYVTQAGATVNPTPMRTPGTPAPGAR